MSLGLYLELRCMEEFVGICGKHLWKIIPHIFFCHNKFLLIRLSMHDNFSDFCRNGKSYFCFGIFSFSLCCTTLFQQFDSIDEFFLFSLWVCLIYHIFACALTLVWSGSAFIHWNRSIQIENFDIFAKTKWESKDATSLLWSTSNCCCHIRVIYYENWFKLHKMTALVTNICLNNWGILLVKSSNLQMETNALVGTKVLTFYFPLSPPRMAGIENTPTRLPL